MNKYEKALLDLIAWAEGTLGVSQNGYDVVVDFYRIVGWTPDTDIVHGGYEWNMPSDSNSTAAGRYQFKFDTWKEVNGNKNVPMTKENQDKSAIKKAKQRLTSNRIDKRPVNINELHIRSKFNIMMNKLSPEWASFPLSSDITINGELRKAGDSYHSGQAKRGKTIDDFYAIYLKALDLY